MPRVLDADGKEAVVSCSHGYWLCEADFVSTEDGPWDVECLRCLGFPRDWPAVYTQSALLKALIGKRGRLPGKRVAVAGSPTAEESAEVAGLQLYPLQSFANAQKAAAECTNVTVVRGWAIFERLDRPSGAAFVAERYWWNALPNGKWVDLTPRPAEWSSLLLVETAAKAEKVNACPRLAVVESDRLTPRANNCEDKVQTQLTLSQFQLASHLAQWRFGDAPAVPAVQAETNKRRTETRSSIVPSTRPVETINASTERSKTLDSTKNGFAKATAQKPTDQISRTLETISETHGEPEVSKQAKKKGLDYTKFANIEDSDDEALVVKEESISLPMGLPRDAVSRSEYDKVWCMLLRQKDLPFTPAPDLDRMWTFYQNGGMDEQALLDQACEVIGHFPCRLEASDYKGKTYSLMKKFEMTGREDEARMWAIVYLSRFPKDADAYYNMGVLLGKMCDTAKFGGAPSTRLPALDGAATKNVPTAQYCSLFSRAAASYYRRCLKVDPKQRPAYINLIGNLERNEPTNWYEDVHEIAAASLKNGVWYNKWQRPPHFVSSLCAKPWHDPEDLPMCCKLREHYPTIRKEYDSYIEKLTNRKDWDDKDTTPGLGIVGGRDGALHDGGLTKSGSWREVPLFTNGTLQRDYAALFPETVKILQSYCGDAVGLAFCGGGDVIFSVLTPGSRLRPHCGPSNARLTCHLGIRVPRTLEQGCRIRLAAEAPRGWREGECMVFDDSFEHEVVFDNARADEAYPGDRVVLLANFWHPDFQFKNDPEWREKSDKVMGAVDIETLPQTALAKLRPSRPSM